MDHFDDAPMEVDISDGKWYKLIDAARAAKSPIAGCRIELGEKKAVEQKRHEPILNTTWHQKWWKQRIPLDGGTSEMVSRVLNYAGGWGGPRLSIIIDCGEEINQKVVASLTYIIESIDQFKQKIEPLRIEILGATRKVAINESELPCTVVVNEGHYRRKAVKRAQSSRILIMGWQTLLTREHLYFFQKDLVRDLVVYYADKVYVRNMTEAGPDMNLSIAGFSSIGDCVTEEEHPLDLDFVLASRETWKAIKVPPDDVSVHDWFMRFVCGYVAVKFESPVWSWKNHSEKASEMKKQEGCCGFVQTEKISGGDTTVFDGKRARIR
jgi:hypothetical protein